MEIHIYEVDSNTWRVLIVKSGNVVLKRQVEAASRIEALKAVLEEYERMEEEKK